MAQSTKRFTISLPTDVAERIDAVCDEEGTSRSAFVCAAVGRHLRDRVWDELFRYGEERARDLGIGPEDVERLVEEYRQEVASSEQ